MNNDLEDIVEFIISKLSALPEEVVQRLNFNSWAELVDRQAIREDVLRGGHQ